MTHETQVVDDVPTAFADLVERLGPETFALSGGSTAKQCYRMLGDRAGDWSATTFLVSDERWVPIDHPDSNEGQARREWLDRVRVGHIASLRGDGDDIEQAAKDYDAYLRDLGHVDLCHLGLGDDGHTASLFPGSRALQVTDRLVVAAGDESHEWPRLTLTYPAIERCHTVIVTATGEGKRGAWNRVKQGDQQMPAARIQAARVVWLVDRAAAGRS